MTIGRIIINDYKKRFGETQEEHNNFARELKTITLRELKHLNTNQIDMYNMDEEKHNYRAGVERERLVIFGNATMKGCGDGIILAEPLKINGIENDFTRFLSQKGTGVLIVSENGIQLAEWFEETYELNILFDLFKKYNQEALNIYTFIMKELERLVFYPKTFENSWKLTKNKAKLTNTFTDAIKASQERQLNDDVRKVTQWEADLNNYRRSIKSISDNLIQKRRQIDSERESIKNVGQGLIKDLDLIIANPKVEDLQIENNKFIIYTVPLNIHSDKGKVYYGGKYRIELDPNNSDVAFFGDNPRKGLWTEKDPHPHVNGNTGEPCLGNMASTVAELCSQMQIYALVIMCIDYLESANTADSAGKNVIHWDEIDTKGKVTKKEKTTAICEYCDNEVDITDLHTVYEELVEDEDEDGNGNGDYHLEGEGQVCTDCRDDNYHYNEDFEAYIRD